VGTEDQADCEEPRARDQTHYARRNKASHYERRARDRRRKQAVDETHLDVHREGDRAAHAGEHRRLEHRSSELEIEEAMHFGKSRQVDRAARAANVDSQEQ
jgi:hypothetical protein